MKKLYVLIVLTFCALSSCNSYDDTVGNDDNTVVVPPKSYSGNWKGVYAYNDSKEELIGDIFLSIDQDHNVTATFTQYNLGTIGTWGNGTVSDDGILELDYNWGVLSGKIVNDSVSGIIIPNYTPDRPIYWVGKKI